MKYTEKEIKRAKLSPKTITWTSPLNKEYILKIPNTVYPPKEDTNLLAETLAIFGNSNNNKMLEIGCGSGIISMFAETCGWDVIGCDINPLAIATSRGLAKKYEIKNIEFIEGGVEPKSEQSSQIFKKGPFDLIVWNLPYLETPKENEFLGPLEDAALADISNGENGNLHELLVKKIESEKCLNHGGIIILIHNDIGTGRKLTSECRKLGWATRCINEKILEDGERLLATALWKPWESVKKIKLEQIDSTNSYSLNEKLSLGTLVSAKNQIKGRGQRENAWKHFKGGWCGSWTISLENTSAAIIQANAGLAVLESIAAISSEELPTFDCVSMANFSKKGFSLKWPNDLLFNSKKFAGILSEAKTQGNETRCVIGIGCNLIDDENIIETMIPGATSLEQFFSEEINSEEWEKILHASIASRFEKHNLIKMDEEGKILNEWWLSMEQFNNTNVATINSNDYHINSLNTDGSIGLISRKYDLNSLKKCDESFNINWKKASFD